MGKEAVRQYYDAFTTGDRRGDASCAFRGPVLLIGAHDDPVIPAGQVAATCRDRFPGAEYRIIDESGHWPHLQQPRQTADAIVQHLGW
jgi:pimeloyl-ACP methyl ester carboxylesterase